MEKEKRRVIIGWILPVVAAVLALVIAMIFVPADKTFGGEHWGWVAGTFWYWKSFLFEIRTVMLANALGQAFFYFSVICAILLCILGILKKQKKMFIFALLLVLLAFVGSYLLVVLVVGIDKMWADAKSVFALILFAFIGTLASAKDFFVRDFLENIKPSESKAEVAAVETFTEEEIRQIVRDELGDREEAPVAPAEIDEGKVEEIVERKAIREERVREIVIEELSKYEIVDDEEEEQKEPESAPAAAAPAPVAEKKPEPVKEPEPEPEPEPAEEPAKEPESEPEPVEEPAQEEPAEEPAPEPEEAASEESEDEESEDESDEESDEEEASGEEGAEEAPAGEAAGATDIASMFPNSRRRMASFETKLKGSDYDLRHKYYDLRDYIKSYGVNNRISRAGDTFSLHREKLVFITISGKRMKIAFALDPKDYEGSAFPVTENTSKKFEDLPLGFKVKSDLSFRRAKKLVDDVMAKKGYTRNE